MKQFYPLKTQKKLSPKKETIEFLLNFSKAHKAIKTKKRVELICLN